MGTGYENLRDGNYNYYGTEKQPDGVTRIITIYKRGGPDRYRLTIRNMGQVDEILLNEESIPEPSAARGKVNNDN